MVRTLSQLLTRALADVGEHQRVALAPELAAALEDAPKANGAMPDVAIVVAHAITALGELDIEPLPDAREIWAILSADAVHGGFVETLPSKPTGRVTRIYHPLAVAEVGELGLVLVEVVKGTSARDVAREFGVPCFAGPALAQWPEPPPVD